MTQKKKLKRLHSGRKRRNKTMIDKSLRKAKAERYGNLIVVHMIGGGDCLWLNMYLDGDAGQMTCDSDIGSYAYHWGPEPNSFDWTGFWCKWLSNAEWLLRKCCGERKAEKQFDLDATLEELRLQMMEGREEDARERAPTRTRYRCADDVLVRIPQKSEFSSIEYGPSEGARLRYPN